MKRSTSPTRGPGWPAWRPWRAAGVLRAKGGMAWAKITPRPVGSTRQPMMSRVSGQVCSAAPSAAANRPRPPQHAGRRAVAEQGGGDDVGLRRLVDAEGQRAELHADEQHHGPGSARPAARPAPDRSTPGAAQAEHRHARASLPEPQAAHGARLQAGRGDPGGRDGDDDVHVARRSAPPRQRGLAGLGEEVDAGLEIGGGALGPAARLQDTTRSASPTGGSARRPCGTPAPCAR
jgi:hypothetical protein